MSEDTVIGGKEPEGLRPTGLGDESREAVEGENDLVNQVHQVISPTATFAAACLLAVLLAAIWGPGWTVDKLGLEAVPPFTYGVLRLGIATIVLALVLLVRGRIERPSRHDMPVVLGGGLGQIAASLILMNIALPFLPAGRTALLAYTTPIWVAGIQAVVFRARPSKREAIALVLGLGGIGLLLNPASIDWRVPGVLAGSSIMLLSAALMGGTILLLRHHQWEGPTLDLIFWETLVALVPLGLLAVAFDAGKPVHWGVQALFCVLYSGALETAFGYWASQTIQRALPPMATSVILLAVPIVGILTGAVVLGETISLGDVAGFAVTLTGIVTLSLIAKQRPGTVSTTQVAG